MKPRIGIILFSAIFLTQPDLHASAAEVDLEAAYRSAIQKNETAALRVEDVVQAEEQLSQAKGSLLPTISAVGTHQVQETPSSGAAASSPSEQQTAKITATQPLFKGLREYAGLRLTKRSYEASRETLLAAKNQLYADVADSYYTVLFLEQEVKNLTGQQDLLTKRLKEIQGRIKIGRSRQSEGYSLDTTLKTTEAQLLERSAQLRSARQAFSFVTGLPPSSALSDQSGPDVKFSGDLNIAEFLKNRPDLRAARAQVEAARESVTIAKGGHLPSLDLNGNYYLKRPGLLQDVHWDVQLVLTIPLFSGGVTQSLVREASSKLLQAEITETRLKRDAERQIRTLADEAFAYLQQVDVLKKGTASAEKDYQEQLREYRLGLVNNLQVLQTLMNFKASQLALEKARYNARVLWARFRAATGGITQ
ncbi:MAG: TolC family protein [Bdellovibrionia bacterium]